MRYGGRVKMFVAGVTSIAIASDAGAAARYQPANLFGTGYADEQLSPGVWEVRGASATPDGGHAIAIYRAAELAQAAGVSEIRVVRQKIVTTSRVDRYSRTPIGFVREVAHLTVRAVRDPADRSACEERDARRCVTLSVAKMLAQFGPELGESAGPHPELAAGQPGVHVGGPMLPPDVLKALAARGALAGASVTPPAAYRAPTNLPAGAAASDRPLSAYDQGRLAALAARGADQSQDR